MHSVSLISQQKEVQRKLGRNMLLLQQCELQLKAMLPVLNLAGTLDTLESNQKSKIARIQKKTLGQLVGEFLKDGVTSVQSLATSAQFEISSSDVEATQPYFSFRLQLGVSDELNRQLANELKLFTEQRNELVHHLLERFDLQTPDSCSAAESYLDEAYAVFKNHLDQLKGWHETTRQLFDEQRKAIASPEFERWLVHGIHPDGSIVWPYSSIVRSLLRTWKDLNQDGWIMLDDAIATIKSREPDLSPSLFGCKSWRQLLKRSQQFEIRLDNNSNTGRGQCWFRPKKEEQHGETVKN